MSLPERERAELVKALNAILTLMDWQQQLIQSAIQAISKPVRGGKGQKRPGRG